MRVTCRKRGADLAPREGAGRPAIYCSVGCRRATEFELRRHQKAIEVFEKDERAHRENMAVQPDHGPYCCGRGEVKQRHLDRLEAEAGRLEARMRVLLDDGGINGLEGKR